MKNACIKCLLPSTVPEANLDDEGICELCKNFTKHNEKVQEKQRIKYEKNLEKSLRECKCNNGDYDVMVSFSGGKDSIYLLHRIVKEYKLRVLAYTSNYDMPTVALDNISRTIKKLGIDHIVYTPKEEFYKKFIVYLLKNQNKKGAVHTVCYFWLNIREGDMLKIAMEKNIPLILTGYAPGQPEPERMLYEMPIERIRQDWTPYELFESGLFEEKDKKRFWDGTSYSKDTRFPRFLACFHAWKYNQQEVIETVSREGYVSRKKHAHPLYSNFILNWLFMYLDIKKLGYNPYMPEFSKLIREGKASYKRWKILYPLINFMIINKINVGKQVNTGLKKLGVTLKDLGVD